MRTGSCAKSFNNGTEAVSKAKSRLQRLHSATHCANICTGHDHRLHCRGGSAEAQRSMIFGRANRNAAASTCRKRRAESRTTDCSGVGDRSPRPTMMRRSPISAGATVQYSLQQSRHSLHHRPNVVKSPLLAELFAPAAQNSEALLTCTVP